MVTLLTAYSLESRAGFVSHRLRSWDSPCGGLSFPEGSTAFQPWMNLPTVGSALLPVPKHGFGLRSVGFQVRASRKCPESVGGLGRQPWAPPLGLAPRGHPDKSLGPDFSRPPLAHFTGFGNCSPDSSVPQSIDQPLPRLARTRTEVRLGQDSPYGVFAPACS